ncbi:MAG: CvpA family protein [bacterium]
MTLFDFILILVLFGFTWFGFWAGLIKTFGSLIGVFVGAFFSGLWYQPMSGFIEPFIGGNGVIADVVGFILVYMIATQLFGIAVLLINKAFNIFAIVPGMKLLNRMGGGILGFIEGTLLIGIVLQFISRLPLSDAWIERLAESDVVGYFAGLTGWLVPLFPKALEGLTSIFIK